MEASTPRLPSPAELSKLLRLQDSPGASELVAQALLRPVEDFLRRPSKGFRGELVRIGARLSGARDAGEPWRAELLSRCTDALESIHAGSLIVDDIQDGSRVRRGQASLHLRYGTPVALNAGNWLYFWPLELIGEMGLDPAVEARLYRLCHRAMVRAHFGQAIDVGVPIDSLPQEEVAGACMAAIELKSGALAALAICLGAAAAGASPERIESLDRFGHGFGVALQMFDDLGNLGDDNLKRYEDLYLRRPSWIWAFAAESCSPRDYEDFARAVRALPDESYLKPWLALHGLRDRARAMAVERIRASLDALIAEERDPADLEGHAALAALTERLVGSYGT